MASMSVFGEKQTFNCSRADRGTARDIHVLAFDYNDLDFHRVPGVQMLVRSLPKHLKEQNWFGIFLDFLVVVLGIFIGLQVSNWNQTRLDRQDAAYHLNFLYDELLLEITAAAAEIEQRQETMRKSFRASMLLSQEDWDVSDYEQFKESVPATFELWGPRHLPVSLRQMIDGGRLDLIRSRDTQRAILKYESAYLDAIEQTETSYAYSLQLTPKITSSMRFRGPVIVSTAEELTGNATLRAAVRDKAIWQRIQFVVLEDLQVARIQLKEFLEANVGLSEVR